MSPHFVLKLQFRLHGCASLKEKRSRLANLLNKLKKKNVSVIESDRQDDHQFAEICIAKMSLDTNKLHRDHDQLLDFIEMHRGDIDLIHYETERFY